MPPPDDRCDDLFYLDDYSATPIIHGWQTYYTGFNLDLDLSGGESHVISTTRRKVDGRYPYVTRSFDASCFAGLGGHTYTLSGKIWITDANDNFVETDGKKLNKSARLTMNVEGVNIWSWWIPTIGDGTWYEFEKTITLPVDSSSASKAFIRIDEAVCFSSCLPLLMFAFHFHLANSSFPCDHLHL